MERTPIYTFWLVLSPKVKSDGPPCISRLISLKSHNLSRMKHEMVFSQLSCRHFWLGSPQMFLGIISPYIFFRYRGPKWHTSLDQTTLFELSSVQIGLRVHTVHNIKKKNTRAHAYIHRKAATLPYSADETPKAITINFVSSPVVRMLVTCAKFRFDRSKSFHPTDSWKTASPTGSLYRPYNIT